MENNLTKYPVVFASKAGAKLDSNVVTGKGTDDTAVLQKVLDLAKGGGVHLVMDGAALVTGLRVHSNTTIECLNQSCGFFLADGANQPILLNANPSIKERIDQNITLKGGVYNGNCLNQVHHNPDNSWVVGIAFYGIENLEIRGITIRDQRTFALHLANWYRVLLEDIVLDLRNVMLFQNQDGIHLNGPGWFLAARNIQGNSEDDFFAINADDGTAQPLERLSKTRVFGPWVVEGDITDVTVDGLILNDSIQCVRMLSSISRIDRVFIRNVIGTNRDFGFIMDTLGSGNGNFGSIVIDTVDVRQHDPLKRNYGWFLFTIGGRFENLTLRNIRRNNSADNRPLILFENDADIRQFSIEGLLVYEKTAAADNTDQIIVEGSVDSLSLSDVSVCREKGLNSSGSLIHVKNRGIRNLYLSNIAASRLGNLVKCSGGNIERIQAVNVHDEESGNGTFSVGDKTKIIQ